MNATRRILLVLVIAMSAAVTTLNAKTATPGAASIATSATSATAARSWLYCAIEYIYCCTLIDCSDDEGPCDALYEACLNDE